MAYLNLIFGVAYLFFILLVFHKKKQILVKFFTLKTLLKRPEIYILLLTAIISSWVYLSFWKEGLPSGWDSAQHYFRCWLMENLFLPNFKVDGWSPYWYLGVQQFLFYSPLLFILVVLFHFFTFQLISLAFAYKIFYFLVYFCLPFICYWLMRQLEIDPLPSSLAAMTVPSFSALHGLGIESLFMCGLFTQAFGLLLFCLSLGLLIRLDSNSHSGTKNTLLLGLSIGILLISHIVSSIYLGFCFLIFMVFKLKNKRFLVQGVTALFIGLGLASFVLWPAFYFRNLMGANSGFGDFDFFGLLLSGKYFSAGFINIFAMMGVVLTLVLRKNRTMIIILCLAFLSYLFAFRDISLNLGIFEQFLKRGFRYRILPFLGIYFVLFSAFFYQVLICSFAFVSEIIHKKMNCSPITFSSIQRTDLRKYLNWLFILMLGIFIFFSSGMRLFDLKKQVLLDTDFAGARRAAYLEGFYWLKDNTPQNSIVAFDDRGKNVGSVGFNQFASQINIHANRYTLQGNAVEMTKAVWNGEVSRKFADWSPDKLYNYFIRYNVSYLYAWNDDAIANFSLRPDLFSKVFDNRIVTIWKVKGHDFYYLSNNQIKIEDFAFSPERIFWKVVNGKNDNNLVVAVTYHPNWKLKINGLSEEIIETEDHLISFEIPNQNAGYRIELKFEKSLGEKFFYLVSLVVFSTSLFFLSDTRRKIKWLE
jgi:hypothetical protein